MPINPFNYDRADDTGDDTEGHIIRDHDPAGADDTGDDTEGHRLARRREPSGAEGGDDDTEGHRRRESPRPEIFDLDR
jgi:hypothetical protein